MNNVVNRFMDGGIMYPIEAKYLERIGFRAIEFYLIKKYSEHPEYLEKEQRDRKNKEDRQRRAYARVYKWLMYSVKNNHLRIEDKPPIAAKPIIERMYEMPFNAEDVLNCKGVYFLYRNNKLLYVGSSKNIYIRIKVHYWGRKIPFNCFKFILFGEEYTMSDVVDFEYCWINDLLPPYNKKFKR